MGLFGRLCQESPKVSNKILMYIKTFRILHQNFSSYDIFNPFFAVGRAKTCVEVQETPKNIDPEDKIKVLGPCDTHFSKTGTLPME